MKKEISLIVVVLVLLGGLVYWAMNRVSVTKEPVDNTTATSTNDNTQTVPKIVDPGAPSAIPGQVTGNITIKINKVEAEGKKVFYTAGGKEYSVSVTSSTKLVKQINVNGLYKDANLSFVDLKSGQFVELSGVTAEGAVSSIRLLK